MDTLNCLVTLIYCLFILNIVVQSIINDKILRRLDKLKKRVKELEKNNL